ncbi:MAG: tetratricopeptide repeat protein [Bryobacterales bacterium]|nr:tetratricopeptide repeat protein [Bryobacterales bacterium]
MFWIAALLILPGMPVVPVAEPLPIEDLAVWRAWGEAYHQKQEPEKAVEVFERILRTNPRDVQTLRAAVQAWNAAGEHGRAETRARELVRLRPFDAEAHYWLGLTLVMGKRSPESALHHLRQAAEDVPLARLEISRILLERGQYDEATRELRQLK